MAPAVPVRESSNALVCAADAERLATANLPAGVRDFVAGGSGAELTKDANRAALDRVYLVPRVLTGVAGCDTSATMIGCQARVPVAVAPMAYQRMVHRDGEVGIASACAQAGIPYAAAMLASTTIEEIAGAGGCLWLQLYWLRDRGVLLDLIRRAEAVGCRALILTVDVPEVGRRLLDLRNGFAVPPGITAANLPSANAPSHIADVGSSGIASHTASIFDPVLRWDDVAWLRDQTSLPLVLKGVLDPADACLAADLGVAGIVVSNHGGRQLDGALPSIMALPPVLDAVDGRCQVLFDSGIRSGTDVLKAIALGADGVLLGRPALWGLAAGGAAGAGKVLSLLGEEFRHAMTLAGCQDLASARALRTVFPASFPREAKAAPSLQEL